MYGRPDVFDEAATAEHFRELLQRTAAEARERGRLLLAVALGLAEAQAVREGLDLLRRGTPQARPRSLYPLE